MVTPEEVKSWDGAWLDNITNKIDKEIKNNHGDKDYEYAIIPKKISKEDRDSICKAYIDVGWRYTYHKIEVTSDGKNFESHFVLSMKEISEFSTIAKAIKNSYKEISDSLSARYHFWTEIKAPEPAYLNNHGGGIPVPVVKK